MAQLPAQLIDLLRSVYAEDDVQAIAQRLPARLDAHRAPAQARIRAGPAFDRAPIGGERRVARAVRSESPRRGACDDRPGTRDRPRARGAHGPRRRFQLAASLIRAPHFRHVLFLTAEPKRRP